MGCLVTYLRRRDQPPAIPVVIRNAAGPARANRRPGCSCDEFPRNASNRTSAEPPGSFASRKNPCIPEKPPNIKPQRILSITGKKSIIRGIVPMTNTPARSAQPSDKPAYVPPRVLRLGDLNEGAGACTAGSGVVTGICETTGANATQNCFNTGTGADSNCLLTGGTAASGACGGGLDAATCSDGGTATVGPCGVGSEAP